MIFDNGEELLTIKDIARSIAYDRSDEGLAKVMRQIRHWTQNDLLFTVSEKHTGKGVPRLYRGDRTIEIASVLLELSRYGIPLEILKPVAEELWSDEGLLYLGLALSHLNSYLQLSWKTDSNTGAFIGAEITMFDDMELQNWKEGKAFPLNQNPSSSILVNMSVVMTRIYSRQED